MVAKKAPSRRATPKKAAPIKLDIACGQAKPEGWVGIDLAGDADIVHDLFSFPWPLADNSVSEVRCSHFVEHIPHYHPNVEGDVWWAFWNEVYRICQPGAEIELWHPWGASDRAWWDPTHTRAIMDVTWYYLDPAWRTQQGLDHYPTTADFEVVVIDGMGVPDQIMQRNESFRSFAQQHYRNVFADLHVRLRARKG